MTNLYNSPAQAEFINTYTPVPFDTILQAGLMKEQQYEQGARMGDELFDKFKALDVAQPDIAEKNARLYTIQNDISQIMDKYKDLGSSEFRREMERYKGNVARDQWWSLAVANKPVYEKMYKDYLENIQKNKQYNYTHQAKMMSDFNKYGTEGLISSGQNYLQDPGSTGYADFNRSIEETMKNVKADGKDIQRYDEKTGLFKITEGREGVAYEKLVQAADANYGSFLASTEGENFKNYAIDILQRNGEDVTSDNVKKIYDAVIGEKAKQFVWKKTKDGIDFDSGLASYLKQEEEDNRTPADFTGDAINNSKTVDYENIDKNLEYKKNDETVFGYLHDFYKALFKEGPINYSKVLTTPYDKLELTENAKRIHDIMTKNINYVASKYNVSKDEAATLLNDASNQWLSADYRRYNVISSKNMERMKKVYDENFLNSAYKVYDKEGKEIPVDERSNYDFGSIGSFSLDTDIPSESGVFYATVVNKSTKKTEPVRVTLPNQLRGIGASAKYVDDAMSEAVITREPIRKEVILGYDKNKKPIKSIIVVEPEESFKDNRLYIEPKIYVDGTEFTPAGWRKLVETNMRNGINSIE